MSMNLIALLYLVASVFFIQALKGLSHPTTSIRGNLFGMTGMTIAVLTTIGPSTARYRPAAQLRRGPSMAMCWRVWWCGGAGAMMAKRVEMTKMPELVAFMHSMIGLAAVFIAVAVVAEPYAFQIVAKPVGDAWQKSRWATAWSCRLGRGHWCHHLLRLRHRIRQAEWQVQVPPVPRCACDLQGSAHAESGAGPGPVGLIGTFMATQRMDLFFVPDRLELHPGRADHHPHRRR